jgi:hypothetical protein
VSVGSCPWASREDLLPFAKKALLRHHESFDSSSTELAPDSLNSSFVGTDH